MASTASLAVGAAEEVILHSRTVSLSLLLNRRTRVMRVVDFRSGFVPDKRQAVADVAVREGMERVYTLVERDEVSTWQRLGLRREGSIPGFYKRSDAWILGALVESELVGGDAEQTGTRRALGGGSGDAVAERSHQAARRLHAQREGRPLPPVRVQPAREADCTRATNAATKAGRALTAFDPFSRDVEREYFACTARGGFSLLVSVEMQPCFNNAFIELLTGPRTEKESALTCSALSRVCDELGKREAVACFSLSPVGDAELAVALLASGFRRTGVLRSHLVRGDLRADAFVWSRKLAIPTHG